jgi:hypothetical protein
VLLSSCIFYCVPSFFDLDEISAQLNQFGPDILISNFLDAVQFTYVL